jgi:hypothetical protein
VTGVQTCALPIFRDLAQLDEAIKKLSQVKGVMAVDRL